MGIFPKRAGEKPYHSTTAVQDKNQCRIVGLK
jgi:hypothetical protein